jgi:hypothetical protein
MSQVQFEGILRALIPGVLGWAAGKGLIPGDQVAAVGAAVVTLVMAGWSIWSNRAATQVKK